MGRGWCRSRPAQHLHRGEAGGGAGFDLEGIEDFQLDYALKTLTRIAAGPKMATSGAVPAVPTPKAPVPAAPAKKN